MRVAALYDIHGNLPALEAVLKDVRRAGVDQIVAGGDVVPGPMPREVLACLHDLEIPVRFIHGNGDRAVLAQLRGEEPTSVPERFRGVVRWTAEQLDCQHEQMLASWSATLRLSIDGLGGVLFCHATPRNDTEVFTRRTPDARLAPVFGTLDVSLVVCGHTHMQFDRRIGQVRVVNAGSVGMPFGRTGADWLLLGPRVELKHTDFDLAGAAERVRQSTYPQAEDFAARNVLQSPSQEEVLDAFARSELAM
jgi:putative phosphoesterase